MANIVQGAAIAQSLQGFIWWGLQRTHGCVQRLLFNCQNLTFGFCSKCLRVNFSRLLSKTPRNMAPISEHIVLIPAISNVQAKAVELESLWFFISLYKGPTTWKFTVDPTRAILVWKKKNNHVLRVDKLKFELYSLAMWLMKSLVMPFFPSS